MNSGDLANASGHEEVAEYLRSYEGECSLLQGCLRCVLDVNVCVCCN